MFASKVTAVAVAIVAVAHAGQATKRPQGNSRVDTSESIISDYSRETGVANLAKLGGSRTSYSAPSYSSYYAPSYKSYSSPSYSSYYPSTSYSSGSGSKVFNFVSGSGQADLEADGLSLEVGESATIILRQNLSTGYEWELNEDLLDGRVVKVTSENQSGYSSHGYTGVPGTKVFTVYGLQAGTVTLQAAEVRPWEFDGFELAYEAANELTVEITVGGGAAQSAYQYSDPYAYDYGYGYSRPSKKGNRYYSSYYPSSSYYGGYSSPAYYGSSYSRYPSYSYPSYPSYNSYSSYNRYPSTSSYSRYPSSYSSPSYGYSGYW